MRAAGHLATSGLTAPPRIRVFDLLWCAFNRVLTVLGAKTRASLSQDEAPEILQQVSGRGAVANEFVVYAE